MSIATIVMLGCVLTCAAAIIAYVASGFDRIVPMAKRRTNSDSLERMFRRGGNHAR